jgi:hypothetical protein
MEIYLPYAYCLTHKLSGKRYYGISYANSRNKVAHPSQLWVSYFGSSSEVKRLIKEHGKDTFDAEVRKTFASKDTALMWEHKVLRRLKAAQKEHWLNKHNGGNRYYVTSESAKQGAATRSTKPSPNRGRKLPPRSPEHRRKQSEAHKGKVPTDEARAKMSAARKGRKQSPEHVRKRADSRRGKSPSLETRRKIAESLRNRRT